jgi:hypothetical protein
MTSGTGSRRIILPAICDGGWESSLMIAEYPSRCDGVILPDAIQPIPLPPVSSTSAQNGRARRAVNGGPHQ